MKNIKIVLLLVALSIPLFNSCVPHSKEILIYSGEVDLELGDYCTMAGRIIDSKTKKPLIGANIIIIGKHLGANTDASGSYLIEKIPPGDYNIKVLYIGFELIELIKFNFEKGNYYLVDFELLELEPNFDQY